MQGHNRHRPSSAHFGTYRANQLEEGCAIIAFEVSDRARHLHPSPLHRVVRLFLRFLNLRRIPVSAVNRTG